MASQQLIGITEFRSNAKDIIDSLGAHPVTVLSRSKPVAVVLHPDRYEALLDRLDELSAQLSIHRAATDDFVSLEQFHKEMADLD